MSRMDAEQALARAETGRRGLKDQAARLDADSDLRAELCALARERGVELPDDAIDWPAKRLLRRALAREESAQERRNFLHRDEPFICAHCGAEVGPGGAVVRDHCPRCIFSIHIDEVPGDRAARCGGPLEPVGAELAHGRWTLTWRCQRCGATRRNREHPDDDRAALAKLSARSGDRALAGR